MHDRAMQALHALSLAPIAEVLADRNSYGFREGRRCADALEQCFIVLSQKSCAPWVQEGDIRACFDEISQPWLLQHVPMDKQLLAKWLQAGYWEEGQLFPTSKGTPQGGLISPLLANLALDGMEQAVEAVGRRGDKIHFVRYADDFIVTGANRQLLEQKVTPAQTAFLQPRGLELSEQKTVITPIQEGFDFLGHTVRKYGDKLLITPAKSKVKILRQKISRKIQSALGLSQEALLRQLNPLLRGWANYYRNGAAKETFAAVDHYVFHKLRRWAARRHPKKSQAWKKRKYFSAAGETGGWRTFHDTPLASCATCLQAHRPSAQRQGPTTRENQPPVCSLPWPCVNGSAQSVLTICLLGPPEHQPAPPASQLFARGFPEAAADHGHSGKCSPDDRRAP